MSAAPAPTEESAAAVAAAVRDAPFVRVVAGADGDALAASGVLARALRNAGVPFQIRVDAAPTPRPGEDDETVLAVGTTGGDHALSTRPASVAAFETARELGDDPYPVVALAGVVAAGSALGADDSAAVLSAADDRLRRRPGVGVPTADLAEGVAHSTLVSAPVSGDPEAARAALADLELSAEPTDDDHRRLASWLAIETATAPDASERSAEAVERALRPHATPGGPFETVEGFGDVLDALARERPGTGVAVAIRGVDEARRREALEAWRTHARAVHGALADATTGRYDGLFVARVEASAPPRLATVARLCLDFHSPESVVLVVSEGAAAAASVEARELGRATATAVESVDAEGTSAGRSRRATARFEDGVEVSRFIAAFREAL
ncbi:MAG: exonuclease RecJ [Haloplanus sp.]